MDHEKKHYRRDENGVVRYSEDGKGAIANLQQRTAIGKHKDGSVYLRATDADDLGKVRAAADALGISYRQRRGGASHFGRVGSYEHLHFDHPADAAGVHAVLAYHLEENGETVDHEAHLTKLSGGLKHHVQGKDARVDACMVNTRHAHQLSQDAAKADTPEVHRSAAQLHRLSAEAHRAQAARPWTKGEGAHHAGMAILHDTIAKQHDEKAVAAHKRIQAELRRKAELKRQLEAKQEGREVKKGHVEGDSYVMSLDEAIAEHEDLVHTLETPSHQDDAEEAREQGAELEEMREARKNLGTAGAGTDLSTLSGGGALRAENHDEEISDATMAKGSEPRLLAEGDMRERARRETKKGLDLDPLPEPTPAQIEAGNYQKHHVKVHGLDIAIENPKDSIRRGVDKGGRAWETKMAHDYGYLKRSEGADGDGVDVFVGPQPENPYVHVVNQLDPATGDFDEHKVMMGFPSREAAIKGYHANYEEGWKGCGDVKTMHVDDFKHWLRHGDTTSRLIYKAATTRLHGIARVQMQHLRVHPGARMSCGFTDAVDAAKTAGLTNAEILRTVSNATGAFAPLLRHLKENA